MQENIHILYVYIILHSPSQVIVWSHLPTNIRQRSLHAGVVCCL